MLPWFNQGSEAGLAPPVNKNAHWPTWGDPKDNIKNNT